jgi:hypothetical protein
MSCKSGKNAITDSKSCSTYGTVKDYTNVEDCGYLIETESGEFLFPQGIKASDPSYRLSPNQNIRFNYSIITNTTSLCVEKGKTAEITCLNLLNERPTDCLDTDVPNSEWMVQLTNILRPTVIYKYLEEKEILYLFDCPLERALYDCKGQLKCQHFKTEVKKCKEIPTRIGKVIYKAD